MKTKVIRGVVTVGAIILMGLSELGVSWAQISQSSAADAESAAKPLMLEKNEGELRLAHSSGQQSGPGTGIHAEGQSEK